MSATTLVLHQYAASLFSEKIRIIFGMKGLAWSAVEIPSIMPKPDLMPLTGGYRKTPVLQIGADIYCDTQIIVREIERRFPAPTLFPGGDKGLGFALGFWSDRTFFQATVSIVFGAIGALVPDDFKKDREKMFPERPFSYEQMRAASPMLQEQWRAHAGLLDDQLADGRAFLTADKPGLADASAYHVVWFLNNATPQIAERLLAAFPRVRAWFDRMKKIGHGQRTDITGAAALGLARDATPKTQAEIDDQEPNAWHVGDAVSVMADDYGRDPVTGTLLRLTTQEVVIKRRDPEVGEVAVHFPRAGFLVMKTG